MPRPGLDFLPGLDLLVVWVTTACQLRCRYCSMRGGEVPGETLDPGLFARALSTLGIGPGAEVQIAGGEPTLVPDVLAEVVSIAHGAGVRRIGVQTNGLGIDDAFLSLVRDFRVGVGVSLDGPAEVNDATRGRTTEVLAGLRRLDDAGIAFGITTVLTRQSAGSLSRLALLLAGFRGARRLGLDVLRPVGRGRAEDLPSPAGATAAIRDLSRTLEWINARRDPPLLLREAAMVDCARPDAYCPAEQGRAAVLTPSGALYPCSSLVGLPEHAAGTVDRPDMSVLRRGLHPPAAGCASCRVSGCRGRCPARRMVSATASAVDCALRHAVPSRRREEGYAYARR